ncbi:MAG: T9SS type A sorting domain-containing protein [Chitinophagales bacterium]|nr:T9SS type A sorting domain-containing protein [Chitinophagales bacterium]
MLKKHPFFRHALRVCLFLTLLKTAASAQNIQLTLGVRQPLSLDYVGYNGMNTTHSGEWWNEPDLMKHIPLLKPKTIRYPGGSIANWWDWKSGWFIDRKDLPQKYKDLTPQPNTLENFKKTLDSCHATTVYDLNMMTSTVSDQIKMLKHAQSIGMDVTYIELGNEFYILGTNNGEGDGDSALLIKEFPTANAYGDTCTVWIDSIRRYFPNAKIAAQGTFNKTGEDRRETWDELVATTLKGEDAITYHCYYAGENPNCKNPGKYLSSDIAEFLWRPFDAWNILYSKDLSILKKGNEAWITEYNLDDAKKPVHGSWSHALFIASYSMQFLQDARIKMIECHDMNGNAVHGTYFESVSGLNFSNDDNDYISPPNPQSTTPWDLTAAGIAMKVMGVAMDKNSYTAPLYFGTSPSVTFKDEDGVSISYPALFGFHFSNSNSSDAVILNLSDKTYNLTTTDIFPKGGTYDRYDADPLSYPAKESQVNDVSGNLSSATLTLKPYSITHITSNSVPDPPPAALKIKVTGSKTFCEGDSLQLDAGSQYINYKWSTGATSQKIWVRDSGLYTVRAYTDQFGYAVGDTVFIHTNPLPKAPHINLTSGKKEFCKGGSAKLSPSFDLSDYEVLWNNGMTTQSITVTTSGDYWLTITDKNGCQSNSDEETITVDPLPKPVITANGPTSFCYNESVTLDAGKVYESYEWSDGKHGQTVEIDDEGSYTVTVKNDNNCEGTSPAIAVTVWTPGDPNVTVNGPKEFCDGTSPTYLSTQSGYSYQWQRTGTNIPGATAKTYYPTENGNYRVIISDNHSCTKTSDASTITVDKLPSAKISIDGPLNLCLGGSTILQAKTGTGYKYQWLKNGVIISGATLLTYVAIKPADYTYTVTDNNGCSSTADAVSITSNCKDGLEPDFGNGILQENMQIYPNPALNQIHVQVVFSAPSSEPCLLQITNLLGAVLYSAEKMADGALFSDDIILNTGIKDGVYIVAVRCGKEIQRKEFIVASGKK